MDASNQLKNQHLLWRAGFGPKADDLDKLADRKPRSVMHALWGSSASSVRTIDVADDSLKNMIMGGEQGMGIRRREMSADERKAFQKEQQAAIKRLNLAWLDQMVAGEDQLREKMSLFWHGHFASRTFNIVHQQQLLDIIRRNALGHFGDLLGEVSKSGAMINFLNNNQNRKDHPNENFAREVMELFTMGRGNYTEQDVKEAARAFTGWGATPNGEFQFRPRQHDEGQKTVLGKTGAFDGGDVLNILLEQRATARHISDKLYRYLVDDRPDETRIDWLAGRFYQSHYDIKGLLEDIFHSDWFYDPGHIGSRIKSPVELLVGIRRILPMKLGNDDVQLLIQRLLGQVLFYPPNVAGWPGGLSWIDSSSLMFRLSMPQLFYGSGEIRQKPKDDDDQMMGLQSNPGPDRFGKLRSMAGGRPGQMIRAQIDWTAWLRRFDQVADDQLFPQIGAVVLQTRGGIAEGVIQHYTAAANREELIKKMTIQLMSTPEYQLC
ncbi:MAG: DUF1800 domain-containing protein [Bacteroidota bacterium]|nr:DUF1800 domain-containing protein [Bacteroidota bacterium]MDP4216169.1 DUF1800 domain-containing protein [Bacteroidota bacterium]MDP4258339.1 DUF1800 domain-containing protein [Bacteroidota bacterium]